MISYRTPVQCTLCFHKRISFFYKTTLSVFLMRRPIDFLFLKNVLVKLGCVYKYAMLE